jgi:hypothetical protein
VSVSARERPPNRPAISQAAKPKRHSRSQDLLDDRVGGQRYGLGHTAVEEQLHGSDHLQVRHRRERAGAGGGLKDASLVASQSGGIRELVWSSAYSLSCSIVAVV